MSKRFTLTIATVLIIALGATIAAFLAKGYTFSPQEKRIVGTGIITVTSVPEGAPVFIDGHLTSATNATIPNLSPKEYTVRVVKEGFIPWEKKVTVREGLVTDLKVTLFPAIPTVYPLTYTGIKNPVLSPDGSKLAFIVPTATDSAALDSASRVRKAGVWIWTFKSDQPIAFARGAEPHQIAETRIIDYTNATLRWSPDSKQVLATVGNNNYLLDDQFNSDPRDITPTLDVTLKSWAEDSGAKESARVANIADSKIRKIASDSAVIKWSPDETKFMFRENEIDQKDTDQGKLVGGFKVVDVESGNQYDLPEARLHFWLPNSRHIVLVEENQISILDFDGTNKAVIYAGKFEDSFVFAWPDSSRLVFISSFPTPTASQPNLYGVNLK